MIEHGNRIDSRCAIPRWTGLAAAVAAALAGTALPAHAQMPTGGTVVGGAARITPISPQLLTIQQQSDRAIIDWTSFSIGATGRVDFQQPSTASAVLNRVTGGVRSVIDGQLTGNGRVYLLNPSGVLIGADSRVDVGSFLAAGASATNAAATAWQQGGNQLALTSGTGGVEVRARGAVTVADGGFIVLAGPAVRMDGLLFAKAGRVRLGAGSAFSLDFAGDGLLSVSSGATQSNAEATASGSFLRVGSTGDIVAEGGTIALTARAAQGLLNTVIGVDGKLWAQNATGNGTTIELVGAGGATSIAGRIDAEGKSGAGGRIRVTGDSVTGSATAALMASGTTNGGSVFIDSTAGSSTLAGAMSAAGGNGAGGTIVLRATGTTTTAGEIVTKGTSSSSRGSLTVEGSRVDFRSAYDGGSGTLSITSADALTIGLAPVTGQSFVSSDAISRAMKLGAATSVNSRGLLAVTGTIDGSSTGASQGSISLSATGGIQISNDIATQGAAITLSTPGAVTMSSKSAGVASQLTVAGPTAAAITVNAGTVGGSSAVTLQDVVTPGELRVTQLGSGAVTFATALGGGRLAGQSAPLGGVDVTAANAEVTFSGSIRSDGALKVSAAKTTLRGDVFAANGVDLTGPATLGGNVVSRGAPISFGGALTLDPGLNAADGTEILVTKGGKVDGSAILEVDRQTSAVTVAVPKRTITIDTTDARSGAPLASGANVTFKGNVDVAEAFIPKGPLNLRLCATNVGSICESPDTKSLPFDPLNPDGPRFQRGADYPLLVGLTIAAGSSGVIAFEAGAGSRAATVVNATDGRTLGTLRGAQLGFNQSTNTFLLSIQSGRSLAAGSTIWVNGFDTAAAVGLQLPATGINNIYNYSFSVQNLDSNGDPGGAGPLAGADSNAVGRITNNTYGIPPGRPGTVSGTTVTGVVPGTALGRPGKPDGVPSAPLGSSASLAALAQDSDLDPGEIIMSEPATTVGGRGVAAEADLGQTSAISGAARNVFSTRHHVVGPSTCKPDAATKCPPTADPDYMRGEIYD